MGATTARTNEMPGGGEADRHGDKMLQHLLSMSQALAGRLDFQSAIQAVSEEVRQILVYDHFDVCIILPDGETHVAYETGLHTSWGQLDAHPVPTFRSPIRALLWGQVPHMITADATADERFRFEGAFNHPIFDARLRSRLHVPLRVQGSVIGALSASTHQKNVYGLDDVKTAQHVADLLAPYFFALRKGEQARQSAVVEAEARAREEGLRLGALRLTEALERERQRIGMDLHDQTLGDLTRLFHQLCRLSERETLAGADLAPAAAGLTASMQELRRIIDDARPNVLQLFGFEHGLEDLLDRSGEAGRRRLTTRLVDETGGAFDRLDEPLKVALFRIVQEAVNNAAKHADADHIVVTLARGPGGLVLAIEDDGSGIAPRPGRRRGGLDIMRTRARLVSADFAIGPGANGTGTRVTIGLSDPAGETPGPGVGPQGGGVPGRRRAAAAGGRQGRVVS